MSKRKPAEEEPDPEGPWANKQFHPTKSSYSSYRQQILSASSAKPVGGPPILRPDLMGPMEQFGVYIQLRDPKPLLELVSNYQFKDYQLEILLAQSLRANLLEVVGRILEKMPALLTENLAEYAVRTREVTVLSLSFIVTLLAEKNSTTVEQTAQGVLKRLGQDQFILGQAKVNKLKELAREGAPADQPKEAKAPRDDKPKPVFEHLEDHDISRICFSPNGKLVAYSHYGSEAVKVWDWRTNRLEKTLDFPLSEDEDSDDVVSMFAFSPDGQTVYAASHEKGQVLAHRLDEEKASKSLHIPTHNYPRSMAVSHNGKLLAIGRENNQLHIIDTVKWSLVREISPLVYGPVTSVCFSLDDRQLLVATMSDDDVKAYDTDTWADRVLTRDRLDVHHMVGSPIKPLVAGICDRARTVWYFNYQTGENEEVDLADERQVDCHLEFSGHGRYLIAVSLRGEVTILDTENKWKRVYYVETGARAVHMDASPTAPGVIATCNRGVLRVFDLNTTARAQESLGSAVSSGLANWGQPQSAWDVFLSHRLRDPRLFPLVNQFLTGCRHYYH